MGIVEGDKMKLTPTQIKVLTHLSKYRDGSAAFSGHGRAHYLSSCRALVRRGLLLQGDRNTDFYINDRGREAIAEMTK